MFLWDQLEKKTQTQHRKLPPAAPSICVAGNALLAAFL